MANIAANPVKYRFSCLYIGRDRTTGRGLVSAHIAGVEIDIAFRVIRLGRVLVECIHRAPKVQVLRRQESVGDTLLIEVGIGGETQETGVLILPPEATDSCSTRSLR